MKEMRSFVGVTGHFSRMWLLIPSADLSLTNLQPPLSKNLPVIRHKIAQKQNYPFSLRLTARDMCRFCQECPDDNPRHVYIGSYCYIRTDACRKAEKYCGSPNP